MNAQRWRRRAAWMLGGMFAIVAAYVFVLQAYLPGLAAAALLACAVLLGVSGGALLARAQGYSWPRSILLGVLICVMPWYINVLPERAR